MRLSLNIRDCRGPVSLLQFTSGSFSRICENQAKMAAAGRYPAKCCSLLRFCLHHSSISDGGDESRVSSGPTKPPKPHRLTRRRPTTRAPCPGLRLGVCRSDALATHSGAAVCARQAVCRRFCGAAADSVFAHLLRLPRSRSHADSDRSARDSVGEVIRKALY